MSESLERLARNQALFREVNERVEKIAGDNNAVEFVCECSNTECIESVELTLAAYERIRSNSTWFVIKARPRHPPDREDCFPRRRVRRCREARRPGRLGGDGSSFGRIKQTMTRRCVMRP